MEMRTESSKLVEELQDIAQCSMHYASFRSNLDNPPGFLVHEMPHLLGQFKDLKSEDLLNLRPDAVPISCLAKFCTVFISAIPPICSRRHESSLLSSSCSPLFVC